MRRFVMTALVFAATGCASTAEQPTASPPPDSAGPPVGVPPDAGPPDAVPPAPWSSAPIAAAEAPGPLLEEWRNAGNRTTCAPLSPESIAPHTGAEPRAAYFGGGWAVAWDLPGLRSAFGVAGTGVAAADPSYDEWPHHTEWADGSIAGYGPEGGTGPKQLAYLRVTGQQCLYNVWSNIGIDHLEQLLGRLRFVRTAR